MSKSDEIRRLLAEGGRTQAEIARLVKVSRQAVNAIVKPEKTRKAYRRWQKANPEKCREYSRRAYKRKKEKKDAENVLS